MELKFNVKGKERKALVGAISEILNQPTEYLGMPSAAYNIGGYHIDKNGTLTGEHNLSLMVGLQERGYEAEKSETFHLITPRGTLLMRERFDTAEQAQRAGYGMYFTHKGRDIYTKRGDSENSTIFAMVGEMFEETALPKMTESDHLSIEYPPEGFTPKNRVNLEKLVASKAVLIKKALEVDELPIIETDTALGFPWFSADLDAESITAHTQFICALCKTAKEKKRIVAKVQDAFKNEKFAMRVWLIGLGLVGAEYKLARKLYSQNLTGESGWRYGKPEKADNAMESEASDNE